MKILKYDIKFDTFFKKGVPDFNDMWGCYGICGYQGSGKTYYAVYLLLQLLDLGYSIKTNIRSLKIPGVEAQYFEKISDIVNDVEEYKIIVIDELSKKYPKESKTDKDFYAWLQQSRKRHRIVILITQEWKELPMWLRRPMRFIYTTHKLPFLPLFCTSIGDALNLVLNKDTMEWEAPVFKYVIYKRTEEICNMYDTLDPIQNL